MIGRHSRQDSYVHHGVASSAGMKVLSAGLALCGLLMSLTACGHPPTHPLGAFSGYWNVHVYSLTIESDGAGRFNWPLGRDCGPPFEPSSTLCPPLGAEVQASAQRSLIRIANRRYLGEITGSPQTYVVPDGPVQLSVGPNDVLNLHFSQSPQIRAYDYLCGAKTNRSITNCGA